MYCSNCGKPTDDSAKFCPHCGNALQQAAKSNSISEIKSKLTETMNNLTQKQKTIIISAVAVVLVVILIIVFVSSCGAGANNPKALVQKYVNAVNSGHDDKRDERILSCFLPELVEYYYNELNTDDPRDILYELDGYLNIGGKKIKAYEMDIYYDDNNPYLLNEIGITADQSATIAIYIEKIDGYDSEADIDICKVNGKWYIYNIDAWD